MHKVPVMKGCGRVCRQLTTAGHWLCGSLIECHLAIPVWVLSIWKTNTMKWHHSEKVLTNTGLKSTYTLYSHIHIYTYEHWNTYCTLMLTCLLIEKISPRLGVVGTTRLSMDSWIIAEISLTACIIEAHNT